MEKIFGTSKKFYSNWSLCKPKSTCQICDCDIGENLTRCELDCTYYVEYKSKNIEIIKKHSITLEDLKKVSGRDKNYDRKKLVDILYKDGLDMYPNSSELRKKILRYKIDWAIMRKDYRNYGFFLMDPYTLEEIEKFEKEFSDKHKLKYFKISKFLRKYLLEISREILIDSYPVIFELDIYDDVKTRYVIGEGGCAFSSEIDIVTGTVYSIDCSEGGLPEVWGTESFEKKFNYLITYNRI